MTTVDTEHCRSCNASVIWATHAVSGNPAPINAEPEAGGNIELHEERGTVTYIVVPKADRGERTDLRKGHFATCRHAASWRRS